MFVMRPVRMPYMLRAVPKVASVDEVMPGQNVAFGAKNPIDGSLVVSYPRVTASAAFELFPVLIVCVKLPPNVRLWLPRSQLKSSLMFQLGVLRGALSVRVVAPVINGLLPPGMVREIGIGAPAGV